MKPRTALVVIGLAVVGLAAGHADAQRPSRVAPRVNQHEVTTRIAEAMRLVSTEPDRALDILEELNRKFPDREPVLSRLAYVYQIVGDASAAEATYRRALEINPRGLQTGKSLGSLYFSKGRDDEGMRVFKSLIEANSFSVSAYKVIGGALDDLGRPAEALQLFEEGRRRGDSHAILALEIAALHTQMENYREAIDEYLVYVGDQPRNYRFARDRMLDVLSVAGDQQDAVVASLEQRAASGRGNRYAVLDVLSAHYLETGLLEKSLEKALAADQEQASDGSVLLHLTDAILTTARNDPRADKARYLELGMRALDAFSRNHPRQAGADRAKHLLATIYIEFATGTRHRHTREERLAFLDRAVDELAELSRRFPNGEYAELAYVERGDVLLHRLKRPRDALDAYKSGAVNSRRIGDVFAGRIADIYLGLGEFDSANQYFDGMIGSREPVLMQAGYYYTGLMLAFQDNFEEARDTLTSLAEADPSSRYANDAIEMAWIIEEALQYDSKSLSHYMWATRAQMLGDTTKVIAELRSIVDQPVYETLRPRALFWLGRTLYESGDLHGALSALQRFLKEYPDEDMRPAVQRQIAGVYEFGFAQYERALREYEAVLVGYPEYAFLDEVRKDVRRLRYVVKGERNGQ